MKVADCMTRDVETVTPEQPMREAAQFMLRADTGVLPVCDGGNLSGMVTDRDIAVRGVAEGRDPDTPVREVMTKHTIFVYEDADIEEASMLMSDHQVRRLPVKSRDDAAAVALGGVTDPGGEHNQASDEEAETR
mgnify:CR=1 FL=1